MAQSPAKTDIDQLALLGGPPAFAQPVCVGRPNLGDPRQFFGRMQDVLERRWLTNHGELTQEFERRLAEQIETRHVVAVCNATVGLQIALRAAGVAGSVIVPAFTFVATAHAASWMGLRPILCDVAPGTYHLDPDRVAAAIAPDTTAILAVHTWGEPCHVDELSRLARRHGLRLLFDAAHAFGCSYRGRPIGGNGLAEVFSFHATKFLNSFEGGAIATDDDELAERARQMRDFGFNEADEVVDIGTNGKLCEAAAAMGLTNLECFEEFVAVNQSNYHAYRAGLRDIAGLTLMEYRDQEARNYQYVVLDVDARRFGIDRDQLWRLLASENVHARRYFYPGVHRAQPYVAQADPSQFPNTERLCSSTLTLPTGTGVDAAQIEAICRLLRFIGEQAAAIGERLAETVAV